MHPESDASEHGTRRAEHNMNFLNNLPFNWFDVVVFLTVFVGLQRGRKHGMSDELIRLMKWITIALGCAFVYQPLGDVISGSGSIFSPLSSYLMAYFGAALVIVAAFALIKKAVGGKLVGSDTFGPTEFYLGMAAGVIRFACMLIVALAILNARAYNSAEVQADLKYQNDVYGSDYFPQLYMVQAQVFDKSFTGPWIKNNLSFLLIKPTPPTHAQLKQKDYAMP